MPRLTKRDPYCDFNDDRERRLALNTKVRWYAVAFAIAAVADAPKLMESFRWLMHLFH